MSKPKRPAKSKPAPKSKAPRAQSCDVLVVGSKVKAAVKAMDLRGEGGLVEALSDHLRTVLKKAGERAKARGQSTIRAVDL